MRRLLPPVTRSSFPPEADRHVRLLSSRVSPLPPSSDLTAAHGQRLRELYDLLEAFSAKEGTPGKQAWEEFEETFSIEKG